MMADERISGFANGFLDSPSFAANGQKRAFLPPLALGSAFYGLPADALKPLWADLACCSPPRRAIFDRHVPLLVTSTPGFRINRPEDGMVPGRDRTISPHADLAILRYPVISMITKPHATSRKMLIGEQRDEKLVRQTSRGASPE